MRVTHCSVYGRRVAMASWAPNRNCGEEAYCTMGNRRDKMSIQATIALVLALALLGYMIFFMENPGVPY